MTFAVVNVLSSQPGWLTAITIVVLLFIALTMMAYMTYYERKVIAFMQDRLGPTRTGPRGLLQPAADGIKLLFKEDIIPAGADRWVFFFAPIVVFVTAPDGLHDYSRSAGRRISPSPPSTSTSS